MRHGDNYRAYLEGELANARWHSKTTEQISTSAETEFRKLLPFDETTTEISTKSMSDPSIVIAREAFRKSHRDHATALSDQAEIEDELFIFPEDHR